MESCARVPYFVGITRFFTIVPIVPDCTKGVWYKFERISVGIQHFLKLYQLYQGLKKIKKFFLFLYRKVYTIPLMVKLYWNFLYFLIIFCTFVVWSLGTICIILVHLLQEGVHIALKFFVRHFKLLKESIFTTH